MAIRPQASPAARTTPSAEDEFEMTVVRRQSEAEGVVSLQLCRADGRPAPAWRPGAHVDLLLSNGMVRQYSLCGDLDERQALRIAVLDVADGRGGSRHVHRELDIGCNVRVRGPRNNFPLRPAPRYLFIAGGIGITPMLAMVAAVNASGAEWALMYGGRSRASMAFVEDLLAHGENTTIWPQDTHGLLDLDSLLGQPRPDTLVYCCGPEPLLRAAESLCASWAAGALQVERFTPTQQAQVATDGSFRVQLRRSDMELVVPPGKSILEVVEQAGVEVLSSCREGTCGTCETPVLSGRIDHRDSLLDEQDRADGDTMMICVSRALEDRIVLDL